MKTRKVLYADENMMLTNGEVYGSVIYLAENDEGKDFYEISQAEYDEIQRKEAEEHGVIEGDTE